MTQILTQLGKICIYLVGTSPDYNQVSHITLGKFIKMERRYCACYARLRERLGREWLRKQSCGHTLNCRMGFLDSIFVIYLRIQIDFGWIHESNKARGYPYYSGHAVEILVNISGNRKWTDQLNLTMNPAIQAKDSTEPDRGFKRFC